MKLNKRNLKLLPFVTALCVLVLTAVGCRNVMLEQKLRNRNKRTAQESVFPEAYYVKDGGTGDGTAYSTPYNQLKDALDAVQASNGKVDRVIVIGKLTSANATGLTGGGGVFHLKNYGIQNNPITISGMTGGTLDGNDSKTVMSITNCHLRFENITFTKGKGGDGGGLYITGNSNVKLENGARITGNNASNGGGVYVEDATLTIDGAEISNNKAQLASANDRSGGGLYAGGNAAVTINSGLFTANTAGDYGGGVCIYGGTFTMNGGTVSANTAWYNGGGIYITGTGTVVQINGGAIKSNTTSADHVNDASIYGGGGIYIDWNTASFTLKNAIIDSNRSAAGGGGICGYAVSWKIDGAKITNNKAGQNGGGVFVARGTLACTSGTISDNTAGGIGSSIYCRNYGGDLYKGYVTGSITMSFGEFRDNNIDIH